MVTPNPTFEKQPEKVGLRVKPFFYGALCPDPFDSVKWVRKDAVIIGADGKEMFRQNGVEVPEWWNDTCVNVVVEKYFRVVKGVRETSAKQVFTRVAEWIGRKGWEQGVFDENNAKIFINELLYMFVNGMHAFNSPVWFNVGVVENPQCSACFINSIEDNMASITDLAKREIMLFKSGSGTGTNLSPLRSSYEDLSGGGKPSGPVSFMLDFDAGAMVTKSGGGTRRAAKMNLLNIDHPDILEQQNGLPGFITCKSRAEKIAQDLFSTGNYTAEWNKPGNIYDLAQYQNANHSVRVTNEFMRAVENDGKWQTKKVTTGEIVHQYEARDLMHKIAEAAHFCGDPGVQFDTTINEWHTCPSSGRINGSNPCAEYLFSDDTACNLSSLNLLKFAKGRDFDTEGFVHAAEIATVAKEIIVDAAGYPSELLAQRSHAFRTLGLGFTNLGALLTFWGLPYDSNDGRGIASAITAIMCGAAYRQSAKLAQVLGPFSEYKKNSEPMLRVIRKHWDAAKRLPTPIHKNWQQLVDVAVDVWAEAYHLGETWGYRNAQTTVIAPTGTISFLMNADTTGIEPLIAVVTYKKAVGEGLMVLESAVVGPALRNLGYSEEQITRILAFVKNKETIHGAPDFNPKHASIFAEALGVHAIRPEAHVDMMIAVQPFVSGSISKTVNMPKTATIQDIENIYIRAWEGQLKCVAVYRDGCKLSQPVSTELTDSGRAKKSLVWGQRRPLPATRHSITHKFCIAGQDGYFTFSCWDDGKLAELFVRIAKSGASLQGMIDSWSIALSLGLQCGVPFETYQNKFVGMRFEPEGFTEDPNVLRCKSIVDYIFQWLDNYFQGKEGLPRKEKKETLNLVAAPPSRAKLNLDGPPCSLCGNFTRRAGTCFLCISCGSTTGCS